MGRSVNSFTTFIGPASEIDEDRVTLPEKDLWVAVLTRAALDACKGPPDLNMKVRANIPHQNQYNYNLDQARHFFLEGGKHFRDVCEMAGRNPDYVQHRVKKIILRKDGWNVDVPMTSHYRQGPKRGKRKNKGLTGNAYYAAIGKKRGRPKLYG